MTSSSSPSEGLFSNLIGLMCFSSIHSVPFYQYWTFHTVFAVSFANAQNFIDLNWCCIGAFTEWFSTKGEKYVLWVSNKIKWHQKPSQVFWMCCITVLTLKYPACHYPNSYLMSDMKNKTQGYVRKFVVLCFYQREFLKAMTWKFLV